MPGVILYPLINGVRHSFASVELVLVGTFGLHTFMGVKSIDYSRTRSRTMVYGTSPDPLGKTRGKNEYKASLELYLAEWNLLAQVPGYGDLSFDTIVTYNANGVDTVTDILSGCTIDTTDASNSDGTDALTRKIELNPLKILFGGIDDLVPPLVGLGV